MRVIYRCRNRECRHIWALDFPNSVVRLACDSRCPQCGSIWASMKQVIATVTAQPCTAVCHGATGAECKCSCGGANHGHRFLQGVGV
jgi:hypothetical protein